MYPPVLLQSSCQAFSPWSLQKNQSQHRFVPNSICNCGEFRFFLNDARIITTRIWGEGCFEGHLPNVDAFPFAWRLANTLEQIHSVGGGPFSQVIGKNSVVCGIIRGRYNVRIGVQYTVSKCGRACRPPRHLRL